MYLLQSSCHPNTVTQNIPFSLALRIVRICSEVEARDQRLGELRQLLLDRDYRPGIVDAAITKAKAIPRDEALKRVVRPKTSDRCVFVAPYDPRFPSFTQITRKHWRTLVQNPQMAEIFPKPPLVAYSRPQNIKDKLIRAKLPPISNKPKRIIPGMHKCKSNCKICPYIKAEKVLKSTYTKTTVQLTKHFNCETSNLVYLIECTKCKDQYIGQTKHTLEHRGSQHLGYIRNNNQKQATGRHFNLPGHKSSHMKISVLERVHRNDLRYREERESHWIEQFNLVFKGMNKKR